MFGIRLSAAEDRELGCYSYDVREGDANFVAQTHQRRRRAIGHEEVEGACVCNLHNTNHDVRIKNHPCRTIDGLIFVIDL